MILPDAPEGPGTRPAVASPRWLWHWGGFLALSEIAVLALLQAVGAASARSPAFLAVLLVALSGPIVLTGTWRASLRRAHELRLFRDGGRLRAILGGPLLRLGAWLVVSLALAVAVFVGAAGANRPTTVAVLMPPVLGLVFLAANRLLSGEVEDPHRRAMALRAAVFLTPVLLVAADFAILAFRGDMPRYATLAEAVRANIPSDPARSAVVDELLRLAGHVNAMEAFALGRVGDWGGAIRLAAWLGLAALISPSMPASPGPSLCSSCRAPNCGARFCQRVTCRCRAGYRRSRSRSLRRWRRCFWYSSSCPHLPRPRLG